MSHNGLRQVASKNANTQRPDPRKDSKRPFRRKKTPERRHAPTDAHLVLLRPAGEHVIHQPGTALLADFGASQNAG